MAAAYLDVEDDIIALASAPGSGALALIRVAGPTCLSRFGGAFSRPRALAAAPGRTAVYGHVVLPSGERVDEAVALVFRAPSSYTGQDGVDLMCHGGAATSERILAALSGLGFRRALPGEFTFRAFAAGRLDLARAEAVDELVRAKTMTAQADALARLSGGLSKEIGALRDGLIRLAAACALRLDYGEDEAPEDLASERPALAAVAAECHRLASTYRVGRLLREGAFVVLAGPTNAGKSSLFNRLLKEERAIVSDVHGTTRDWLEAQLDLDGLPVRLSDTAGLRDALDPVEAEGVRRTRLAASGADAVVYVADATVGLSASDEAFLAEHPLALRVWNKVDAEAARPAPPGWIPVSALAGTGERDLAAALRSALLAEAVGGDPAQAPVPGSGISSARQRDALLRAGAAADGALAALDSGEPVDMIAVDLAEALAAVGELSGETAPEDVLDALFSNFCVGK